jgi:hypothetical protein
MATITTMAAIQLVTAVLVSTVALAMLGWIIYQQRPLPSAPSAATGSALHDDLKALLTREGFGASAQAQKTVQQLADALRSGQPTPAEYLCARLLEGRVLTLEKRTAALKAIVEGEASDARPLEHLKAFCEVYRGLVYDMRGATRAKPLAAISGGSNFDAWRTYDERFLRAYYELAARPEHRDVRKVVGEDLGTLGGQRDYDDYAK